METLRYLTTAYILTLMLVPSMASAYSQPTHQAITQETIQAYEAIYGDVFTVAEEKLIINGSDEEDHGTRPLNHFYDPISGKGLTVFKWLNIRKFTKGDASPSWLLDTRAQADWSGSDLGASDGLFSNESDYSWERGIYEYVQNERSRGLSTLGHALHLLQDATVPAHVRNDDHLTLDGAPIDSDPYETYTTRFKKDTIQDIKVNIVEVPNYGSPDEYIRKMAMFTNKNFLSKDTVFEEYKKPNKEELSISDGYGYSNSGLVVHVVIEDSFLGPKYNYDLDSNTLQQAYWDSLSYEAVRHGLGLIDLFLHAAESEADTSALKIKNKSKNELAYEGNIRKPLFAGIKAIYGSSMDEEDVQELNREVYASKADQFRPPTVQNESPVPPRQGVWSEQGEATIIRGKEDGTNEIITPAQQARDLEQMGTALLALESLLESLMSQFNNQDNCNGIDLSILKHSNCIAPADEGGYAYGAGGAGGAGGVPPLLLPITLPIFCIGGPCI